MSEIKWIKITTDMFDDEKITFIEAMPEGDAMLVVWIKLLTLAGKSNMRGHIFLTENIPYNEEMLAHKFRKPTNIVRLALETFQRLGMVEMDGHSFMISNWEKHQNIEALDKIREDTRKRVQKHRDKQKLLPSPSELSCNVTVTENVTHGNALRSRSKKENKEKKIYAEFVTMTEDEYNKLVVAHGEDITKKSVEMLDNYKGANGRKYKSDYRAILQWVVSEVKKRNPEPVVTQSRYTDLSIYD